MKHLLRPIGHCLTTAVVTSAILEASALPALTSSNADVPHPPAEANDSETPITSPIPAPVEATASPETTSDTPAIAPASQPRRLTPPAPTINSSANAPATSVASQSPSQSTLSIPPVASPGTKPEEKAALPLTVHQTTSEPEPRLSPDGTPISTPSIAPSSENVGATNQPTAEQTPVAPAANNNATPTIPGSTTSAPAQSLPNQQNNDLEAARQVVAQELATLVERDKPQREAKLRQNLVASALLYAQVGEFDLARRTARHPALPPEMQTETLAKIDTLEAKQQQRDQLQDPSPLQGAQVAQMPAGQIRSPQSLSVRQWVATRAPMLVTPQLSDQCLPRVVVDRQTPGVESIAKPAVMRAEAIPLVMGQQLAAQLASAIAPDQGSNLSPALSLNDPLPPPSSPSDQHLAAQLPSPASQAVNLPETAPEQANTASVGFQLDKAIGSTIHKSLDNIGVTPAIAVPTSVKSAFGWWNYLAKSKGAITTLGTVATPDQAIVAAEAIADPEQPLASGPLELPAPPDAIVAQDSQLTGVEQALANLPKGALKLGSPAKPTAAQPATLAASPAQAENCARVQPAYYTPSFSLNTALRHLKWGRIGFPLPIPASITSAFGWRIHPISGGRRFHAGVDIGAPTGTPIVAAVSGQVVAADYMGGYGLAVIIEDESASQRNLYAHMSGVAVQPGMVVEQGTVIGWVGSTGNSTGPHLHFETQVLTPTGWTAIDPLSVATLPVSQSN